MDYNSAQENFNSLLDRLQPWALSNFVMWLDLKVAEFKVFGRIISDAEKNEDIGWPRVSSINRRGKSHSFGQEEVKSTEHDKKQQKQKYEVNKQRQNIVNNDDENMPDDLQADMPVRPVLMYSKKDTEIINLDSDEDSSKFDSQNDTNLSTQTHDKTIQENVGDGPHSSDGQHSVGGKFFTGSDRHYSSGERRSSDGQHFSERDKDFSLNVKLEPTEENLDFDDNGNTETLFDSETAVDQPLFDCKTTGDLRNLQETTLSVQLIQNLSNPDTEKDGFCSLNSPTGKVIKLEDNSMKFENKQHDSGFSSQTSGDQTQSQLGYVSRVHSQRITKRQTAQRRKEKPCGSKMINLDIHSRSLDEPKTDLSMFIQQDMHGMSTITVDSLSTSSSTLFNNDENQYEVNPYSVESEPAQRKEQETSHITHDSNSNMEFDIQFPESDAASMKMCSVCFSIFSTISELQMHFKNYHPGKILTPTCVFCGGSFPNDTMLKRHIACNHIGSNSGFHCILCGKEFSQAQHFQGHLNQHRGVQPFKCQRCQKSFTYKTHLTCHMRRCGGINGQFKCHLCHRNFLERGHLTEHIHGMHESANPRYKCEYCGDRFVWRGSLIRHKKLKCVANPARQ